MSFARHPRFRRAAEFPPMLLTPRDAELLRAVHRHRFLRSSHFPALVPGSSQQVLRRLQKLFHHGYVERPLCQLDYFQSGGSRRIVYGLANRGAAYLHRVNALPYHRSDFTYRSGAVRRLFLEHALMVSDILITLEQACRERGDIALRVGTEMQLPAAMQSQREPFQWRVEAPGYGDVGVIPDVVFSLHPATDSQKSILCCLEADRGTMPVRSHDPHRSSLARKFAAYDASWRSGEIRQRFGHSRIRVVTVTSSAERVVSIEAILREGSRARALFVHEPITRVLDEPAAFLAKLLGEPARDT